MNRNLFVIQLQFNHFICLVQLKVLKHASSTKVGQWNMPASLASWGAGSLSWGACLKTSFTKLLSHSRGAPYRAGNQQRPAYALGSTIDKQNELSKTAVFQFLFDISQESATTKTWVLRWRAMKGFNTFLKTHSHMQEPLRFEVWKMP